VTGRALFLAYDLDAPSYRYRMRSIFGALTECGWSIQEDAWPRGRYLLRTWERRRGLAASDVVVVSKVNMSAPEAALFAHYRQRCVFDFDDAIYVRKPRGVSDTPDESVWRRRKFLATCRAADVVVAGNEELANAARPSARWIEVFPTAVNLEDYRPSARIEHDHFTIVWIGRPENLIYLELVRPGLARLAQRFPSVRLRVVCSEFPAWSDVEIERVPWSPHSEVEALSTADVGIMPLTDNAWTRGKCAFKLLQYMAASLPCIASPVGANLEAVRDGVTGFYADTDAAWESALEKLMHSPELAAKMGAAGRAHAEKHYSMQAYARNYTQLLSRLVASN
jgi:glycosyltransferase involved in cell wall biosynthesis